MIEGKDHILKFDAKDEEYWLVSPEDHFAPDTNSNNRRRSGDIDLRNLFIDDMSNPQIKRIEGDALETVNGLTPPSTAICLTEGIESPTSKTPSIIKETT